MKRTTEHAIKLTGAELLDKIATAFNMPREGLQLWVNLGKGDAHSIDGTDNVELTATVTSDEAQDAPEETDEQSTYRQIKEAQRESGVMAHGFGHTSNAGRGVG